MSLVLSEVLGCRCSSLSAMWIQRSQAVKDDEAGLFAYFMLHHLDCILSLFLRGRLQTVPGYVSNRNASLGRAASLTRKNLFKFTHPQISGSNLTLTCLPSHFSCQVTSKMYLTWNGLFLLNYSLQVTTGFVYLFSCHLQ